MDVYFQIPDQVGDDSCLGNGCQVGDDCWLGNGCQIRDDCWLGNGQSNQG
ncbi:MAG: hypothetical protein IJB38_03175 [Bacteroidales bacterium]|nr:hypothetical protein [Bacteroidales bacterium]